MKRVYFLPAGFIYILLTIQCCTKDEEVVLPEVRTIEVSEDEYSPGTIVLKGEVVDTALSAIIETGFYYHTENAGSLKKWQYVTLGINQSEFKTTMTSLEQGQTYYIKAAARNTEGEATGEAIEFKTRGYRFGSAFDYRDGTTYRTVTVGNQIWMTQNLAYLPEVYPSNYLSSNKARYYVYSNETRTVSEAMATEYYKTYGVLYNWIAAQAAIPDGWRLPTRTDWQTLFTHIAAENGDTYDSLTFQNVGKHLKSFGFDQGPNSYGFSAYPASFLMQDLPFAAPDKLCYFWSATESSTFAAYAVVIESGKNDLRLEGINKLSGFHLRLVRDK